MTLTLKDLLTSSGKYPDREKDASCTDDVKKNGQQLIDSVNALLKELNIDGVRVSSGFRTEAANIAAGGAKKSLHMTGKAIDLEDPKGEIDEAIKKCPEILDKFGLWLEDPGHTPGWAHLDIGSRSARKVRIFIP